MKLVLVALFLMFAACGEDKPDSGNWPVACYVYCGDRTTITDSYHIECYQGTLEEAKAQALDTCATSDYVKQCDHPMCFCAFDERTYCEQY